MDDEMDFDAFSIALNAEDRCDRCNAQAYTLARKDNLELLFCFHCKKVHGTALEDDGWAIYDDVILMENHLAVKV